MEPVRKRSRLICPSVAKLEPLASLADIHTMTTTAAKANNDRAGFTLWVDHRQGGGSAGTTATMTTFEQERILIFQSNRAGPIGKLIFSSSLTKKEKEDEELCKNCCAPSEDKVKNNSSDNQKTTEMEMVKATIHVVHVKPQFRGWGLGTLLVTMCLKNLKRRYFLAPAPCYVQGAVDAIECCLEAEEDLSRHGKLVTGFYHEQFGFVHKPNSKIQYLNNNDGETYRKVAMHLKLTRNEQQQSTRRIPPVMHQGVLDLILDQKRPFLPVALVFQPHETGCCSDDDEYDRMPSLSERRKATRTTTCTWLVVEDGKGKVEFHTTRGERLWVSPPALWDSKNNRINITLQVMGEASEVGTGPAGGTAKFVLLRVVDDDAFGTACARFVIQSLGNEGGNNSSLYLAMNPPSTCSLVNGMFRLSPTPILWRLAEVDDCVSSSKKACQKQNGIVYRSANVPESDNNKFVWVCTGDTLERRSHYLLHEAIQTIPYARDMRQKYMTFQLGQRSLWEVLQKAAALSGTYYSHHDNYEYNDSPSLMVRCFATCEHVRKYGHADWVQLLALVYHLGQAALCCSGKDHDMNDDGSGSQAPYDWTLPSRGWVFNNTASSTAYHDSSELLVTWTGPEYMYHFLIHNHVRIPLIGLQMLRFANFSLKSLPQLVHGNSDDNDDDDDRVERIAEFALLVGGDYDFRTAATTAKLSNNDCRILWEARYMHVAQKYELDGLLEW